jgi:hypothetical protein
MAIGVADEEERQREAAMDLAVVGGGKVDEGYEGDKNQVHLFSFYFLHQADLALIYWWAKKLPCLP